MYKLILRNLRRNLRRTILTGFTLALATFIYTILVSVPGSMDRIVHDASATLRLIVLNRSLPLYGLPGRYCDDIRKMPGAAACVAIDGWPATYRDVSDPILAVAEGLEIADVFPDYDLNGDARRAFTRERRGAFAGSVLMRKNGWHPGQQVTLRGSDAEHLQLTFVLLGEMPSKRYSNVFAFRRDYLEEARRTAGHPNPDLALTLVVRVDSENHVAQLIRQIYERFTNSDFEARAVTESDALASGLSILGSLRGLIISLCVIIVLTVLLIAANSSAIMVRERISEVAVMRSLGFGRAIIASVLLGECAAIGLVAGAVGSAAAFIMFESGFMLGALGGIGAIWVTPFISAQATAVALAVSLVSGVFPVWGALRIPPAMAFGRVV
ncbi:MAG TPA: ABC transporter permease [Candidatus Binataceae bacterium]